MRDMKLIRTIALSVVLLALAPFAARAQGPQGWVGVVITTGIGQSDEQGRMVFNDYPVIESIDAGSPAERAGLQAGDILIAINSQDFKRNPIPMKSLLVPGQRIMFRYRRNDVERTSTLLVAERPADTKSSVVVKFIGPVPTNASDKQRTEALLNRNVVLERTQRTPLTYVAPIVIGSGTPTLGILGAELTQLNSDLRDVLNVKTDGLFVINVALGTPAGLAGLRSGDVIIEANRESVQNPGELIRLMRAATERQMLLRIVRKQKPQTLTLRW